MQNPRVVLSNLQKHSKKDTYKYNRLYRNLFNLEFYLMAYDNINNNTGSMTEGIDRKSIDGTSIKEMEKLVESIKDMTYQPFPSKRVYIKKKNGKQRPLGIPSFCDKLVQEVIRMILAAIYEDTFSASSHGFRPNRSCHTALKEIRHTFNGVKWFVEGDIQGFFDNIDHHVLINLLRKRIDDERFIDLIWKFLKAEYMENWKYHITYSGTPQGGIISPILSNIYLNELDTHMKRYITATNQGKERKRNPVYRRIESKLQKMRKKLEKGNLPIETRNKLLKHHGELKQQLHTLSSVDPMDTTYKRIKYVRYADDFLIGIIGSKQDAVAIKSNLTTFLKENLKLNLSQEKTLITHGTDLARFLGYDITISNGNHLKRTQNNTLQRVYKGKVQLKMPHEVWVNKLKTYKAIQITKEGQWNPTHRGKFIHSEDLEIVSQYNSEIRGLYNYYKFAKNVSNHMHRFAYFMFYSMLKTFSSKYKTGLKDIRQKYMKNGEFVITYETANGMRSLTFLKRSFPRKMDVTVKTKPDILPNNQYTLSYTKLSDRLKARVCELCGSTNTDIHMHHVKRLKDVKNKKTNTFLEIQMIARRRKTIALCTKCHIKRHKGEI
ncbi:reverse transcriptase domain-containing protein [Niallia sp. 03133]|uniref:reverse transcriptase domain-containing protein n=1 Tax=Niallia sp. 03133 TaxID=3458060 RepID=UPI0040439FB5